MTVSKKETENYILHTFDEDPRIQGSTLADLLADSPAVSHLMTVKRIFIAGSGRGSVAYGFWSRYQRSNPHIVALDCNVCVCDKVTRTIRGQLEEQHALLHDYLLSRPDPFEIVVIDTGNAHGIHEPHEFKALYATVAAHGVLFVGVGTNLYHQSMYHYFSLVRDTGIPPLPDAWIKR